MFWWFEKKRGLSVFITLVGAVLIFWISSLSFGTGVGGPPGFYAIVYHILAFFFFGIFVFISVTRGRINFQFFLVAFLISFAYALTDEIHQYFVPSRSSGLFDIFLDLVGIVFAAMVYLVIIFRRQKYL